MRSIIGKFRSAGFALAIAGALGFGASSALATQRPCPLTSIGSCPNQSRCETMCTNAGGNPAQANCSNGCCFCGLL